MLRQRRRSTTLPRSPVAEGTADMDSSDMDSPPESPRQVPEAQFLSKGPLSPLPATLAESHKALVESEQGLLAMAQKLQAISSECRRLQTQLDRRASAPTQPFLEEQTFYSFLYEPHTLTALAITLTWTLYVAFVRPEHSLEEGIKFGLSTVVCVFLVYCVVQMRDSLLMRPHPSFWRFIHGCCILYLLLLVFLLCQNASTARMVIQHLDPALKGRTSAGLEKDYAMDCRVHTPGHEQGEFAIVWDTLDIFLLAHLLGWVGKSMMLRDWTLSWILCVLWELVEFSFQHMLPNFYECWWDHWILDVALCNLGGMWIGMMCVRYFEVRTFDWTGTSKSTGDHLKRIVKQFSPYSWTKYTWDLFSTFSRFCAVILLLVVMELVELNGFFLKYVLWIPVASPLNTYRLLLWFFLSVPGLREYYEYLTAHNQRRLGMNVWMAIAICVTEMAVWIKFSDGILSRPIPEPVVTAWTICFSLLFCWSLLKFDVIPCLSSSSRGLTHRMRNVLVNGLFVGAVGALVWMVWVMDVGFGKSPAQPLSWI